MTRNTSSHYAKATLRTEDVPELSGTLPTDPLYVTTFDLMQQIRGAKEVTVSDRRYAVWNLVGRLKHMVRWHTYVPLEEWDPETGSMRYVGMACWHCPHTLR